MRRQPILLRLAIASLVVGAYALVRNLISTFATLADYPNASFLPVFLSTDSGTGGSDLMLMFYVWGPPIFGGIGIALLVASVVTRAAGAAVVGGAAAAATHAWAQPQQGGWHAQQSQQGGWQAQQPQPAQGWQQQAPQQGRQPEPQQPPNPVQPLGGTQPPPPDAADRIRP